ncbi:TetR/AcrR family transcriptional regulator [Nesterenkonia pannonica]|uniref:TetR/AcrR family transcriptional regulator n=1 Tax=Nesterenkonia pannonica TaxID=1548602 RepID=UPI0021649E74|nr:TetR/AcrR family transcriptional regulator [Nesterenkonia pannonica]
MDTIAAEARVTKPILYKNFGNKDGLIAAYLQNRHRWWWPELEAAIGEADSPELSRSSTSTCRMPRPSRAAAHI